MANSLPRTKNRLLESLLKTIRTITANVPENANYTSRPEQSQQLTVNKARQQITFSMPTELRRDAGILTLNGTSSSGLPVSYQVNDPMVATIVNRQQKVDTIF